LACALTRARRVTHFVRLKSGSRKQSLSLHEPLCRDLMLPQSPLSKIETDPPTCQTEKGENRNWVGRLKKVSFYFLETLCMTCSEVGKVIMYLRALLRDIGSEQTLTTDVYEDYRVCIAMIPCTVNPLDSVAH
jgi:hypothetical protein